MKWGTVVMKREFIITAKDCPKVPRIIFVRCKVDQKVYLFFCLCCRGLLLYPSALYVLSSYHCCAINLTVGNTKSGQTYISVLSQCL